MEEQIMNSEDQKNISDLIQILHDPKRLFFEAKKVGGKGISRIILLVILFGFINFISLIFGFVKMFSSNDSLNVFFLGSILVLGISITILAGTKSYNYALTNAFGAIYSKLSPIFRKLCTVIIDKSEQVLQNTLEAKDGKLKEIMDIGNLLHSTFHNLPKFAQNKIEKMLNETPIPAMVLELKSDILNGQKEVASQKLHHQIDSYLTETFFANNSTKWVYWLLPLNILVQYLIITFGIQ